MLKTNSASIFFSLAAVISSCILLIESSLLIGSDMLEYPTTVKPSFLLFAASILFCSSIFPNRQYGISLDRIHDFLVLLYTCISPLFLFGRRRKPSPFFLLRLIAILFPSLAHGSLSSDCRLAVIIGVSPPRSRPDTILVATARHFRIFNARPVTWCKYHCSSCLSSPYVRYHRTVDNHLPVACQFSPTAEVLYLINWY